MHFCVSLLQGNLLLLTRALTFLPIRRFLAAAFLQLGQHLLVILVFHRHDIPWESMGIFLGKKITSKCRNFDLKIFGIMVFKNPWRRSTIFLGEGGGIGKVFLNSDDFMTVHDRRIWCRNFSPQVEIYEVCSRGEDANVSKSNKILRHLRLLNYCRYHQVDSTVQNVEDFHSSGLFSNQESGPIHKHEFWASCRGEFPDPKPPFFRVTNRLAQRNNIFDAQCNPHVKLTSIYPLPFEESHGILIYTVWV